MHKRLLFAALPFLFLLATSFFTPANATPPGAAPPGAALFTPDSTSDLAVLCLYQGKVVNLAETQTSPQDLEPYQGPIDIAFDSDLSTCAACHVNRKIKVSPGMQTRPRRISLACNAYHHFKPT